MVGGVGGSMKMEVMLTHCEKQVSSTMVTDSGRVMEPKRLHCQKQFFPNVVRVLGREMEVRLLQPARHW